jgi:hypothetical protein
MILFEREKCLMPGTLHAVERVKTIRNLDVLIQQAQEEVFRAQRHVLQLMNQQPHLKNGGNMDVSFEKRKFIRKCPSENCKGFLTTQWNCTLCEKHICKDCNEPIENENLTVHECDNNNVQTVELLKKDTKPCPSCGTMIFKISGCNQMWCPECHTAFDWLTLKIETGRVHNPHYYEFQRTAHGGTIAREPGDIPCGGLPTGLELYRSLSDNYRCKRMFVGDAQKITNIHMLVTHVLAIEFDERVDDAESLRVRYMMNELSENDYKKILQRKEKFREKRRDVQQIFRMFCDVISDHMRQIVNGELSKEDCIVMLERLRDYTNKAFQKVQKRYGLKAPHIQDNWSTQY